jgi:hypothetical protein
MLQSPIIRVEGAVKDFKIHALYAYFLSAFPVVGLRNLANVT